MIKNPPKIEIKMQIDSKPSSNSAKAIWILYIHTKWAAYRLLKVMHREKLSLKCFEVCPNTSPPHWNFT
jgi:hypothetical protein